MKDFTFWISLKLNWKKYTILRNLDKYFDDHNEFDFDQFYNENYIIFENTNEKRKKKWTFQIKLLNLMN
jgi:hypothetical protein